MNRPSNLIIAFILAIASVFLAYAFGRMFLRLIKVPQVETENDFESQLYIPQNISLKL
jgi:hypothetical protein